MKNKPYFPMFIDLSDKNIVVAGGGNIATRRIKTLLKFTRNITVVATKVTQELMDLGKAGTVTLHIRLNDEIHRVCKEEGIYVNVASDREACDFYFPGVYMRDEMVVGVTASGLDHKKAKRVREEIQNALEKVLGEQDEDEER